MLIKNGRIADKFDSKHVRINKKYDVIYASNVVDWIQWDELEKYRDNLYRLLNDNGMIICSIVGSRGPTSHEKEVFEKNFDYYDLPVEYCSKKDEFIAPGYFYIKKSE